MKIKIFIVIGFIFGLYWLVSPVVVFGAPCETCCTMETCGGSGTYRADECKEGLFGFYYCDEKTVTQECHSCYVNWIYQGCQFGYIERTCTDYSCLIGGRDGVTTSEYKTFTCCTPRSGNCNDEDYAAGVCATSEITKKCDSTYGSSSFSTSGSNITWNCYGSCGWSC